MARLRKISPSPSVRSSMNGASRSATAEPSNCRRIAQATLSPSPSASSDKENESAVDAPSSKSNKGKGLMAPPPRPSVSEQRGNKRRRLGERGSRSESIVSDSGRSTQYESAAETESRFEGDDDDRQYYDPEQNDDERRKVRATMRENIRDFHERKDELFTDGDEGFVKAIKRSNDAVKGVRHTADMAADARLLVDMTEFALKRAKRGGDTAAGVDLDDFVSKCIAFMRNGGQPARRAPADEANAGAREAPRSTQDRPTQRRRSARDTNSDDEDEDEDGDALPWHVFGARACFPSNRRPPVPSFLLGPLSVQKRVRAQTQRTQRSARNAPAEPVSRPQELRAEDLTNQENNNIQSRCNMIRKRLWEVEDQGMAVVDDAFNAGADEARLLELCRTMHIGRSAEEQDVGVPLFEFTINPHSFGQSVENLFWVSFLIRDGYAAIVEDGNGLPLLRSERTPKSMKEHHADKAIRRQAIVSIDYAYWEQLIDAFSITESLIPHREAQNRDVGRTGWYG